MARGRGPVWSLFEDWSYWVATALVGALANLATDLLKQVVRRISLNDVKQLFQNLFDLRPDLLVPSVRQRPERRLEEYLLQKASDGEVYFKAKFIADEVGMDPQRISALMPEIKETSDLAVEEWSYTSATTWRVEKPKN